MDYNLLWIEPEYIQLIVKLHAHLKDFQKVSLWLSTGNNDFNGLKPVTLIVLGKSNELLNYLEQKEFEFNTED